MSLRARVIWGFVLVALVALIPAALILNAGVYATTMGPMRMGQGMGMHGSTGEAMPVMTPRRLIEAARDWSLWSSLAAFALAGGAGVWTAGRITRSLRHLRDAAGGLDLRDLSRRVPVEGKDEIADLARTFNHMCDRLEAEERSRRQLLADVAHEIRHPLAVMKGRLELLQDGKMALEPEALLPLQDEVIRLTRLVGDLRDLSLAEVGQLSLQRTRVSVGDLLETLMANLEPVAADREIALRADVKVGLPAVEGDPDRLRQVLVNLITNALQHTPRGGRVTVSAAAQGAAVQIRVSDTGPGIAPEDLPHIFDRFYRADKSRSRASGGSGLGLAIVRSLVELHGGAVTVDAKPGEGASFTVSLPAAISNPA